MNKAVNIHQNDTGNHTNVGQPSKGRSFKQQESGRYQISCLEIELQQNQFLVEFKSVLKSSVPPVIHVTVRCWPTLPQNMYEKSIDYQLAFI